MKAHFYTYDTSDHNSVKSTTPFPSADVGFAPKIGDIISIIHFGEKKGSNRYTVEEIIWKGMSTHDKNGIDNTTDFSLEIYVTEI